MALLNVSLCYLNYLDGPKTQNPRVRMNDINYSMLGMPSNNPKNINIQLSPGESQVISSVARTLSFNGSTSFSVTVTPGSSKVRLNGSFGARTGRTDGDATTVWNVTKVNELVTLTFSGSGTAPNFATMQAGDGLTLAAPFSPLNQGDFTIVKVGSNYVQFVNPIAAAESVTGQASVYSGGPVQVGDVLDLTSPQFSATNLGQFPITRVTDQWVEFSNPNAVPDTGITGVTSGLSIYPSSYKWMMMAVDRRVVVKLNGDTGLGTEVEPPVEGDLLKNPGLLMKRGKVFQVELYNPGLQPASGFCLLSE